MAVEAKRGCGYRKVGGLYLVGDYIPMSCDRLPMAIGHCPVCGHGIHFSRNYASIDPLKIWGAHDSCADTLSTYCKVCSPRPEMALLMMVGVKHYPTPQAFIEEGIRLGFSKRIPSLPKNFKIGKTVVYLAHPRAIEVKQPMVLQQALAIAEGPRFTDAKQPQLLEADKKEYRLGVFTAFIPQRIEKVILQSEATPENIEKLAKRGITAVTVPDDDPDHKG